MSKRKKFRRQSRRKSVKDAWRKPRGINSKKRRAERYTGKMPKIGYKKPKEKRGLHPSGYEDILIKNENDLEDLDPETQAARISAKLGKRKRKKVIEKAEEKNIKILNK